ncbi:uncharacterized protein [Watersipora subatra]|uniref:uncharacterized protein n=1 Tax=Watersipora subatra TaxID=2589382 RepID=UPI00355B591D
MSGAVPQLRKDVQKNLGRAKFSKTLRLRTPDSKLEVIKEEEPQNQEIACVSPVWSELQANRPSMRREEDLKRAKTKSIMDMTVLEMYNHGTELTNFYPNDVKNDNKSETESRVSARVTNDARQGESDKTRNITSDSGMKPKGLVDATTDIETKSVVDSGLATTGNVLPLPSGDAVRISKKRNVRQALMLCFGCSS